mmetsp:Transcript_41071/g.97939  ORF Transcript_41071/g.97939 Transcript_41071/m.97939 type:complete len:322 (-) Transcript_41071:127-1092(-)
MEGAPPAKSASKDDCDISSMCSASTFSACRPMSAAASSATLPAPSPSSGVYLRKASRIRQKQPCHDKRPSIQSAIAPASMPESGRSVAQLVGNVGTATAPPKPSRHEDLTGALLQPPHCSMPSRSLFLVGTASFSLLQLSLDSALLGVSSCAPSGWSPFGVRAKALALAGEGAATVIFWTSAAASALLPSPAVRNVTETGAQSGAVPAVGAMGSNERVRLCGGLGAVSRALLTLFSAEGSASLFGSPSGRSLGAEDSGPCWCSLLRSGRGVEYFRAGAALGFGTSGAFGIACFGASASASAAGSWGNSRTPCTSWLPSGAT